MKGVRAPAPRWMFRWTFRCLMLGIGLGLCLLGLVKLGQATRDGLRQRERYEISFADIDCSPPPGEDRAVFLAEVRYLAEMPEQVQFLDDGWTQRLAEAFARHPWVEKVEQVELVPPRQVRVRLVYRTPVLAVRRTVEKGDAPLLGVVDGQGILLPASAFREDLPVYYASNPPAGPAGTTWGDRAVEAAAGTAAFLRPYQERLGLITFKTEADGLVLRTSIGTTVLWGRAPGNEQAGEASAAAKLKTLLDASQPDGRLDKPGIAEYDVRPKEEKKS